MVRHCSKRPANPSRRSGRGHRGFGAAAAVLALAALLSCAPTAAGAEEGGEPVLLEAYGAQPQITEDGRLFAWLYLPELPGHPQLETLYVERAWADEPDAWSLVYTFVWDEDWQEYAAVEDPNQTVRYYNYDTGEDVPCADYFEAQTSRRSFYLRARAVADAGDGPATMSFAPVLFTVPGDEAPDREASGGDASEGGGSGGDKGGIGQGENERPVIEPPALIPSANDDGDEAAEGGASHGGTAANGEAGASAQAAEPERMPGAEGASDAESSPEADDAPAAEDASARASPAAPGAASPPADAAVKVAQPETEPPAGSVPARLPGILVALAASAALAAVLAAAKRLRP